MRREDEREKFEKKRKGAAEREAQGRKKIFFFSFFSLSLTSYFSPLQSILLSNKSCLPR